MTTVAREVTEFIANDFLSYRQLGMCFKNLARHHDKGRFTNDLAVKGLRHVTDPAAQRSHQPDGSSSVPWFTVFTVDDRDEASRELLGDFLTAIETGDRCWDDKQGEPAWA